jgi:predicted Zn-dependent protease
VQAAGGDLTGAIAEYEKALAEEPDLVVARYDLALALANAGRLDDATAQLRELLRRKPGYAPAEDLLARLPSP